MCGVFSDNNNLPRLDLNVCKLQFNICDKNIYNNLISRLIKVCCVYGCMYQVCFVLEIIVVIFYKRKTVVL